MLMLLAIEEVDEDGELQDWPPPGSSSRVLASSISTRDLAIGWWLLVPNLGWEELDRPELWW